MAGEQRVISHHLDSGRVQTAADPRTGVLTGHRVAVAPDADQQTFFAPVALKRLAQGKTQRHKGLQRLSLLTTPGKTNAVSWL